MPMRGNVRTKICADAGSVVLRVVLRRGDNDGGKEDVCTMVWCWCAWFDEAACVHEPCSLCWWLDLAAVRRV